MSSARHSASRARTCSVEVLGRVVGAILSRLPETPSLVRAASSVVLSRFRPDSSLNRLLDYVPDAQGFLGCSTDSLVGMGAGGSIPSNTSQAAADT